jgi:hypothetical protein
MRGPEADFDEDAVNLQDRPEANPEEGNCSSDLLPWTNLALLPLSTNLALVPRNWPILLLPISNRLAGKPRME